MIRTSFFALTLALVGSTAAFAAEAPQQDLPQTVTNVQVDSEYPSQPGPHTVIYREWSDLAG